MMFTASTEFAPGQWVDVALTQIVGMRGMLAAGLCQRPDVRDAPFRRPAGQAAVQCRPADLLGRLRHHRPVMR